jgi:hypothetical protein
MRDDVYRQAIASQPTEADRLGAAEVEAASRLDQAVVGKDF